MTGTNIHRLLDEAFAQTTDSPDVQDLKEELRANLEARVAELVEEGTGPDEAARRAFYELGDLSTLLGDTSADPLPPALDKTRLPAPFVVRTTVICAFLVLILAGGFYMFTATVEPAPEPTTGAVVAEDDDTVWNIVFTLGALALPVLTGFVISDILRRETTRRFAMPLSRAAGYGTGSGLVLLGLMCAPPFLAGSLWFGVVGVVAAVGGAALLAGLGATQTNRDKPWWTPARSCPPRSCDARGCC
ncbi:MAG: permease prefix domain 1-containing protein [Micrococcales bacterium]|nr:permease prefix domain 1-containing protein [Micrococcales bacterium]MCL2668028.1 permease prefix domain 1-containing protein [Micrococcales bacterium]